MVWTGFQGISSIQLLRIHAIIENWVQSLTSKKYKDDIDPVPCFTDSLIWMYIDMSNTLALAFNWEFI
jgi:hypothetical protein